VGPGGGAAVEHSTTEMVWDREAVQRQSTAPQRWCGTGRQGKGQAASPRARPCNNSNGIPGNVCARAIARMADGILLDGGPQARQKV
jgi:hypothetical protein